MNKPSSARIRVLVVDEHTMVRRGLATFLKVFDDLELAGETASGQEAILWHFGTRKKKNRWSDKRRNALEYD